VNYGKLIEAIEGLMSGLGEASQLFSPIIANLPFAGSFLVCAALGFKKG